MKIYNDDGTFCEIPDEELNASEKIEILKLELKRTDYKAVKYAEGWYTEEEYAPIKAERQAIRDKINELEAEL